MRVVDAVDVAATLVVPSVTFDDDDDDDDVADSDKRSTG
jgi:hypothetical protein